VSPRIGVVKPKKPCEKASEPRWPSSAHGALLEKNDCVAQEAVDRAMMMGDLGVLSEPVWPYAKALNGLDVQKVFVEHRQLSDVKVSLCRHLLAIARAGLQSLPDGVMS
jgi:hypothetical protein